MIVSSKQPLLKSELAKRLDISRQSLRRFMNKRESKIKEIDPLYNKHSKILYPKIIDYIAQEQGYSDEEIYNS